MLIVVLSLLGICGLVVAFGYRPLPPRDPFVHSYAIPKGQTSTLDRSLLPYLERRPGESGFALVSDGVEAFAWRALSARTAARSLDVQYYIWHDDVTGRLLIHELLSAADRGVRVRLLLDDLDARANHFALVAIDAHPNVEVRIFNPFASREGLAGKVMEALTAFSRINHRMHNKTWIADNRVAIAGGRNVGDEYFTASTAMTFLDLDLLVVGDAVLESSAAFDSYWNSAAVWPIAALHPDKVRPPCLTTLRAELQAQLQRAARSNYEGSLARSAAMERLASGEVPLHWTRHWHVLTDDPMKARLADDARSAVFPALRAALAAAHREVKLVSGYFVPGKRGTALLSESARAGVALSVLTNSLAATDVPVVHGGYVKYRKALLLSGVALWELKPEAGHAQTALSVFGSTNASLHTKAAVFDGTRLFVGSFNLDPRSVALNCEQGILVDDASLTAEADALLSRFKVTDRAWRVEHDRTGELRWRDCQETLDREPNATFSRRALAQLMRWLPFEAQL